MEHTKEICALHDHQIPDNVHENKFLTNFDKSTVRKITNLNFYLNFLKFLYANYYHASRIRW
jgi:hypothetical protein